MSLEERQCWICLCGENEPLTMGTLAEARDFVRPCGCSLTAHRRCLLDWVSESKEGIKTAEDEEPWTRHNFLWKLVGHLLGSETRSPVILDVKCPQCKQAIYITIPPNRLVSLISNTKQSIRSFLKFGFLMTAIGSILTGLVTCGYVSLSLAGLNIVRLMLPRTIQTKTFGVRGIFRTLDDDWLENKIPPSRLLLVPAMPLYLLSLRGGTTNHIAKWFAVTFPYWLVGSDNIQEIFLKRKDPRVWFLFATPFGALYDLFFALTFNRVYYSWALSVRPCFIADQISKEELLEIENEQEYEQQIEGAAEIVNMPVYKQVYHAIISFFLPTVPEDEKSKALRRKRRNRELKAVLRNDYSMVFQSESHYITLFTTYIWPHAARYLSVKLLSHLTIFKNLGNSPDESEFIRNLIGAIFAVVIKDCANLFVSWFRVNQLRSVQVLEYHSKEWEQITKN